MSKVLLLLVCLGFTFGESWASPFGYHMRVGVPKAVELLKYEGGHTRIIGGSPVTSTTAIPHQAGIVAKLTTGWQSICGGSLISDTRVVSAAHCWWDGESQASKFTIVLGSVTIFTGGTRIDTTDVVVHPNWSTDEITYDLMIVKINKVNFSDNIQAISLPTSAEANLNFAGLTGTVSGYGKTSDETTSQSTSSLYSTTVDIITNAVCQNSFHLVLHSSHLCTSGTGKVGTCDGDSGGPLTVLSGNKSILVGVVSFGLSEGCAFGNPSVYTRVTAFLAWISANISN